MVASRVTHALFFSVAFVFALLLNVYLFAHQLWHTVIRLGPVASADQCDNPSSDQQMKVNPNKMLFISCGGFIE